MDGSFEASDITSQYIRMTITLPYDQIISIPTTNISNGLKLSVITVENNTQKIITVKVHGTYGNSERTVIRTKKIDE